MPRKCNVCEGVWYSQSPKCIHCGSEDIIWEWDASLEKEVGRKGK